MLSVLSLKPRLSPYLHRHRPPSIRLIISFAYVLLSPHLSPIYYWSIFRIVSDVASALTFAVLIPPQPATYFSQYQVTLPSLHLLHVPPLASYSSPALLPHLPFLPISISFPRVSMSDIAIRLNRLTCHFSLLLSPTTSAFLETRMMNCPNI